MVWSFFCFGKCSVFVFLHIVDDKKTDKKWAKKLIG